MTLKDLYGNFQSFFKTELRYIFRGEAEGFGCIRYLGNLPMIPVERARQLTEENPPNLEERQYLRAIKRLMKSKVNEEGLRR